MKFLEFENADLKAKLQEISTRFGEQMSEYDEADHKKINNQIDEDLAMIQRDYEDGEEIDIDSIPDKLIIKEEDRATDMRDFDAWLRLINKERFKEGETQTERVTRRHMKIGVNPVKLGILNNKETFTDQRMF